MKFTTTTEVLVLDRLRTFGGLRITAFKTAAEMNAAASLTRKGLARWTHGTYSITQEGDRALSVAK